MQATHLKVLIAALILSGGLGTTAIAGPVSCEILQYNQGRLYFSTGQETLVFANAPYAVCTLPGEDTLLTGFIEHSWLGVSVGYPIDTDVIGRLDDNLVVYIEPAAIDSTSPITIGTDIPGLRLVAEDSSSSGLLVRNYDHYTDMDQDFQSGLLDGCLSFEKPTSLSGQLAVTVHPLPYVATLIPNVGRACNSRGNLTTSLYYRFDHDRPLLYFDGATSPQMCLRPPTDDSAADRSFESRPYPLDPERGRRLVENIPHSSERIRLFAGSPDLDRLAHYFGDILARDRLAVEITGSKKAADLYLEFVPVSSTVPSTTVYALQHQLVRDSVPGGQANEALRISAGLAELIESARTRPDYFSYLDRMSRLLVTDLGVFPLFRPTLYFSANRVLHGARFDADGFLDLNEAVKIILPTPPEATP